MELLTILNCSRAGDRLTGSGIEKIFNRCPLYDVAKEKGLTTAAFL